MTFVKKFYPKTSYNLHFIYWLRNKIIKKRKETQLNSSKDEENYQR